MPIFLFGLILVPYFLHIFECIEALDRSGDTGFELFVLFIGMAIAPVGWIHGILSLFGAGIAG